MLFILLIYNDYIFFYMKYNVNFIFSPSAFYICSQLSFVLSFVILTEYNE